MKKVVILDDECSCRLPIIESWLSKVSQDTFDYYIAQSLNQLKAIIANIGNLDVMFFDHDLGDNKPNGNDVAKWVVENKITIRLVIIHSANPVGAQNIANTLRSYSVRVVPITSMKGN